MTKKLTKKEIEIGQMDENPAVRTMWGSRTDYVPTAKQLERGLTDDMLVVRKSFYNRKDCVLNPLQHERAHQSNRFSVHSASWIEIEADGDEDYFQELKEESVECPYCKELIRSEETYCKHVALVYFLEDRVVGNAPGFKKEHQAWLDGHCIEIGGNCAMSKFNLLCKEFNLKKRKLTQSGMACGPYESEYIFAFVEN